MHGNSDIKKRFTWLQKSQTQIRALGFSLRLKIFHVLLQKKYKQACKINICFQQKENGIHFHRTYLQKPNQTGMWCSFLWNSYTQQKIVYMYVYFNVRCKFICNLVENFITRIKYSRFQIILKWNRKLLCLQHMALFLCKKIKHYYLKMINCIWSREMS